MVKKIFKNLQSKNIYFYLEGSVPCFLKLKENSQLTEDQYPHVQDIEACAERCFNLSRPGFVYERNTCTLLKSQSNGKLNGRDGYYMYTNSKFIRYHI